MKAILAYCSRSPTFDPEPTFRHENQREAPARSTRMELSYD